MLKALVSTSILVAVLMGASTPADAMTFDRTTRFTFNQPFTLPGVTLPAGTYMFRLANPERGNKVVQVLNNEGTQSYALLLSMPALRMDTPLDSAITFMETGSGVPSAVKIWWTEGSALGYEFIYTREQARRLAAGVVPEPRPLSVSADESVVGDEGEFTVSDDADGVLIAQDRPEAFADQAVQPAPAPAAQTPSPVPTAEPAPAVEQNNQDVRDELPRTAGPLPVVMMLGLATLFGGLWLTRK